MSHRGGWSWRWSGKREADGVCAPCDAALWACGAPALWGVRSAGAVGRAKVRARPIRRGCGRPAGLGLYYHGDDHGAAAVVVADPFADDAAGQLANLMRFGDA